MTAFRLGEINKLTNLQSLNSMQLWNKVKLEKKADATKFAAIFFNFKGDHPLNEKSFRQALAYSIDKKNFSEKIAYSSFAYNSPFYSENIKKYFYDEAGAVSSLGKTIDDKTRKKAGFTLYYAPEYEAAAQAVAANWKKVLNINVKTQVTSGIPYQWKAYLTSAQIPSDPDQYGLWHSSKTLYFSGYRNLKIDKLLEDGRQEINLQKRKEIYAELQKALTEDLPAIFLFYPWSYTISY
jgi:ABC-type transport system substrate-binding protein